MRPLSVKTSLILSLHKEGKNKEEIFDIMNKDISTKITKQGISNAISRYGSNGTPNSNGKPKEVHTIAETNDNIYFVPPSKPKEIIQPAEPIGFMFEEEKKTNHIFDKQEIGDIYTTINEYISKWMNPKRMNDPKKRPKIDGITDLRNKRILKLKDKIKEMLN